MEKEQITQTSMELAKLWENSGFLDGDLLLLDHISAIPFPKEPRRMNFILIALCTGGKVSYTMDTQQLEVCPGDILIAGERTSPSCIIPWIVGSLGQLPPRSV